MSVPKILTHRRLLIVLQNCQNFKEMTSNIVLIFALIQLYYKIKEFTQYSKKKELPNKKRIS